MGGRVTFEEGELRRLIDNDELPEAIKLGNEWLRAEPDNALPYLLTGKARFLWNEFDEAERLLKRAISIDPSLAEAYYLLGEKARISQDHENAVLHMERAVRLEPDNYVYQFALAKSRACTGDLQESVSTMERIFSEHRDDPWMHNNLAEEYVELAYRDWEPTEEGRYFPITAGHVETAERYFKKLSQLKITSEHVKARVEEFKKAVSESKQRKYTGGVLGLVVSFWLAISGFNQGGFWGYLYSASALLYYFALRTPVYVINHRELRNKQDYPLVDRISDFFLGGDWFVATGSVGGTIVAMAKLKLILGILRAALQALFMPLTVISAFFTNYSRQQAVKYVGGIAVFILMFSLFDGFVASAREDSVKDMLLAAETGDVRDLSAEVIDYPVMYRRNATKVYAQAVRSGRLNIVRYMEDKLRYAEPQAGRAALLKLARASESPDVLEHVQARYFPAATTPVVATPSGDKTEDVHPVTAPPPAPVVVGGMPAVAAVTPSVSAGKSEPVLTRNAIQETTDPLPPQVASVENPATNTPRTARVAEEETSPVTWRTVGFWDYDGVDSQHFPQGLVFRNKPGSALGQTWTGYLELKDHDTLVLRQRTLWPVSMSTGLHKICANYPGYPTYPVFVDMPGDADDGVYVVSYCKE